INRRYPLVKILVYPTTVQGEYAVGEIVNNIKAAENTPENDLIILGRGGGSIEDLWAFNEEAVADAIYACNVPIISAVGHETDFTIADFVADKRAPTPSGAAEIAVPDQLALRREIDQQKNRLGDALKRKLSDQKRRLTYAIDRYVLKDPVRILSPMENRFESLHKRLRTLHPMERIKRQSEKVQELDARLERAGKRLLEIKANTLEAYDKSLAYTNPLRLLEEGYTLAKKDGAIIKSVRDVQKGDTLAMRFKDGSISVKVLDKEEF
ncbi:MAG: exodeoxyribonuclease VII large subunit, partial [Bacillota bacterium]